MIYNTIMIQLQALAPPEGRLDFACDLMRRFDANLIGFAAAELSPLLPSAEAIDAGTELMGRLAADLERALESLKQGFEQRTRMSEQATWRSFLENPTECLIVNARAADLIVTGRPASGADGGIFRVDPGAVILSAGRPVLVMADDMRLLKAEAVVVAWADRREARRAVSDAMPFLVGARDVVVATLRDGETDAVKESACDVVRFLMRHGVKARLEIVDGHPGGPAEAMFGIAETIDADLIVSGGYGHSRLREWAFGGMTRALLDDGRLHRLFSN